MAVKLQDDLVQFLRDIIAIPSMSGGEKAVVQRMKEEMEKLGYDKVWIDPLGNLIGQIGSGSRIIAFDGHCDTVDVGDPANWTCDPFKGDYRDGIIYGRGASDQKGGLASAIYAGKILLETGIPEDTTFMVVASVLEEDCEGVSWHYIINEDKIRPHAVVMTEPSSLTINYGQRGRMEIQVKTRGISSHGSAPERGENAVYKMAPVIQAIERLNKELSSDSILGKGSVTISHIKSTSPSFCAVADSATIHLDRRLTEGETLESSIAEIQDLPEVKKANAEVKVYEFNAKGYTGEEYPTLAFYPTWLMEPNHPLVNTAEAAYSKQFSHKPKVGVWTFSTNGVATNGIYNIPTIGFGPGSEEFAHSPNDQIPADDLLKAMQFYAALTLEWSN